MTNSSHKYFSSTITLLLALIYVTNASEDSFPDIKTSHSWVQDELYSLANTENIFFGFKFGELDITIQNNSDSPVYIENFFASLYLEKGDKQAFVFAGVENIMTDIKPQSSGTFRFKFYPKEEIPSVFYFCKVEATMVYNNEKFKQLISFDKVHVVDKPASLWDVEHLMSYVVVFLVVGAVVYGVYRAFLKRFVKRIWKRDGKSVKGGKVDNKNLKEWLPKNIKLD